MTNYYTKGLDSMLEYYGISKRHVIPGCYGPIEIDISQPKEDLRNDLVSIVNIFRDNMGPRPLAPWPTLWNAFLEWAIIPYDCIKEAIEMYMDGSKNAGIIRTILATPGVIVLWVLFAALLSPVWLLMGLLIPWNLFLDRKNWRIAYNKIKGNKNDLTSN